MNEREKAIKEFMEKVGLTTYSTQEILAFERRYGVKKKEGDGHRFVTTFAGGKNSVMIVENIPQVEEPDFKPVPSYFLIDEKGNDVAVNGIIRHVEFEASSDGAGRPSVTGIIKMQVEAYGVGGKQRDLFCDMLGNMSAKKEDLSAVAKSYAHYVTTGDFSKIPVEHFADEKLCKAILIAEKESYDCTAGYPKRERKIFEKETLERAKQLERLMKLAREGDQSGE